MHMQTSNALKRKKTSKMSETVHIFLISHSICETGSVTYLTSVPPLFPALLLIRYLVCVCVRVYGYFLYNGLIVKPPNTRHLPPPTPPQPPRLFTRARVCACPPFSTLSFLFNRFPALHTAALFSSVS